MFIDPSLHSNRSALTPKQAELMAMLADSLTTKEIAKELSVSESAVQQRLQKIRTKLGNLPRSQLVRRYRSDTRREQSDQKCETVPAAQPSCNEGQATFACSFLAQALRLRFLLGLVVGFWIGIGFAALTAVVIWQASR